MHSLLLFLKPDINDVQIFLPNSGNILTFLPLKAVRIGTNEVFQVC